MGLPYEAHVMDEIFKVQAPRPANDKQPLDPSYDPQFQLERAIGDIADSSRLISHFLDNQPVKIGMSDILEIRNTAKVLTRIADTAAARLHAGDRK